MNAASELATNRSGLFWYGIGKNDVRVSEFGLRPSGGGAHQSKTLMYSEMNDLLHSGATENADFRSKVLDENILGKSTASSRESVLRNLSSLYGLATIPPLTKAFFKLVKHGNANHPILALLVALARDPLLRESAIVVVEAPVGASVQWVRFAERFNTLYPGRFSEKMVRSLSQNCASTWTQTGHLGVHKGF